MLRTSDNGIAKIKQWEGFRAKAYRDGGGVWTIGYGHTSDALFEVKPNSVITEEKAEELLRHDLREAEDAVNAYVKVPLNQNQFDALVSFTFNVGVGGKKQAGFTTSTLLKKLNAGDYDAVPKELARWNKDNGKVVAGLTNRRAAEAGLWATGSFVASADVQASPKAPIKDALLKPESIGSLGTAVAGVATGAAGNNALAWMVGIAIVIAALTVAFITISKELRN